MKNVMAILVAVLAAYVGYVVWINHRPPPAPPTTTAQPVPEPTATPAPAILPIAAVTPPPQHLAAEGVYYLTQALSVTTDIGVTELPPGTEVRRIGDAPGVIVVQCRDGTKFSAYPRQLTNDLDVATSVISTYSDQLRNLNQVRAQQAAAYQSQQPPQPQAPSTPTPNGNADAERTSRIAQIQDQISSNRAAIQQLEYQIGSAPPGARAIVSRRLQPVMDQDQDQINALQQQLQTLGDQGAPLQ